MTLAARIALGFLIATGAVYLIMVLPVPWSPFPIALGALVIFALASLRNWQPATGNRPTLIDLVTLLTIIGYAFYATIARPWEWDFWAIWGLKGRVFYEARG